MYYLVIDLFTNECPAWQWVQHILLGSGTMFGTVKTLWLTDSLNYTVTATIRK